MSYYAREERAARRHAKELARAMKDQAKADERSAAQREVFAYENQIEFLLSLHREVGPIWNWTQVAGTLPPLVPAKTDRHERKIRQNYAIRAPEAQRDFESAVEAAVMADRSADKLAQQAYTNRHREWEKLTQLAQRMINRNRATYLEALQELSPLAELADLGSEMQFEVPSSGLITCTLTVKGQSAIPAETKSLTSTGKLTVKATPRGRFHELYQDYVCGSVLRIMRELFAILPVDQVLVTAVTALTDLGTGQTADQPVLSVIASRADLAPIQWETVDPSNAVDRLLHRGDFKASRKSGAFLAIEPLQPNRLTPAPGQSGRLRHLITQATQLRAELQTELTALSSS